MTITQLLAFQATVERIAEQMTQAKHGCEVVLASVERGSALGSDASTPAALQFLDATQELIERCKQRLLEPDSTPDLDALVERAGPRT